MLGLIFMLEQKISIYSPYYNEEDYKNAKETTITKGSFMR